MSRISRLLTARFVGYLVLVTAVALVVVTGLEWTVGRPLGHPWVLVPPLAVVAAELTARQTRRWNEDVAIAVGGGQGLARTTWASVAVVVVVTAAAIAGLGAERGVRRGLPTGGDRAAEVGVSGDLVVHRAAFSAHLGRQGAVTVLRPSRRPAGFEPRPRRVSRARRRLFLTTAPWPTRPSHPLAPRGVQLGWLAWGAFGAWAVLAQPRARRRWFVWGVAIVLLAAL